MDALELQYDDQAAIDALPTDVRGLFSQGNDGKFNLTGVSGLKTQTDVNNVQEALRKEREDHGVTRNSLKVWGDLKHADVVGQLDKIDEYKLAADGQLDDDKINTIVESRITQKTGPLDRQIGTLTGERDEARTERDVLKASIERRDMNDAIRTVATDMKVHATAVADIELVAASYFERNEEGLFIVKADAQGVTPGIDIKGFMKEMQKLRPHWWPTSSGGGAGGGGGNFGGAENPWSNEFWNATKQGQVHREQGAEVAASMAKAAGTSVGGLKPAAKK